MSDCTLLLIEFSNIHVFCVFRTIRAQRIKARVLSSTAPMMRPESNKQQDQDPYMDSSDDES
jgi:hypothetical protein